MSDEVKMKFTGERYVPGTIDDNDATAIEHWQRYISARVLLQDKVVLDIASGEGYGSNYIAEKADFVYGIDISKEAVDYAKQHYIRNNLKFICGSVEAIELDSNSLDAVVSFETIEHVNQDQQKKFLSEVKRVLKEDGILIVSCPNKAIATDLAYELWHYTNEFHVKEFYVGEFKEFLLQHFSSVQFLYQRTEMVTVLNDEKALKLDIILNDKKTYENVQNIIAVCSNNEIDVSGMNNAVLDINNQYLNVNRRLSELIKRNNRMIEAYQDFLKTGQGGVEENISTCRKLVDYYQNSGEKDKQLKYIFKSFDYATPRVEFCCDLGCYFLSIKQYEQAVFWYKLANQLEKPIDSWFAFLSNLQLCVCYDCLGKYQLAYEHNEIAGNARPGDSTVQHNKNYLESMYGIEPSEKKKVVQEK